MEGPATFGKPTVLRVGGPLGIDEMRLVTRIALYGAFGGVLTEFIGAVRWRDTGSSYRVETPVEMPPLRRLVRAKSRLRMELETSLFRLSMPVLTDHEMPEGHKLHYGTLWVNGAKLRFGPSEPVVPTDWRFIETCLIDRGLRRDECGYWEVDGIPMGTRRAAELVLGAVV
jgi:hypothetical protein